MPDPSTAGRSTPVATLALPLAECWICGDVTRNLYAAATPPGSAPGIQWCEPCHRFGESASVQAVKERLLDRVVVLMRERTGDAGAQRSSGDGVGQ
jgi:hypothetical protein